MATTWLLMHELYQILQTTLWFRLNIAADRLKTALRSDTKKQYSSIHSKQTSTYEQSTWQTLLTPLNKILFNNKIKNWQIRSHGVPADFIISFTQTLSRGYETLGSFNKWNANQYNGFDKLRNKYDTQDTSYACYHKTTTVCTCQCNSRICSHINWFNYWLAIQAPVQDKHYLWHFLILSWIFTQNYLQNTCLFHNVSELN